MIDKEKEGEVWKVYPDYPFIEVSSLGRIRTKDRVITRSNGRKQFVKGRVLKQQLNRYGYLYVNFCANGKFINLRVNRMVAITFIPNPHNYPEVNHEDNNRTNNVASNLEWCTRQYSQDYRKNFGSSQAQVQGRSVIAINPDTSEVFWFESQSEAGRQLGVYPQNIGAVVRGKRYNKTAGGYWFCYADETAIEKTRVKFGNEIADKVEKLICEHL